MPVALDRIDQVIKEEKATLFKPLIDDLVESSEEDFLKKIDGIQEWDRSKDDLYVWIPVLNRMDSILKNIIDEHNLDITPSNALPSNTKPISDSDNAIKSESTVSDSHSSSLKTEESQITSQDTQQKLNATKKKTPNKKNQKLF